VIVVPEPLAIFNHDERVGRVSRTSDWVFLFDWAIANREYFTAKAFSFFIATYCVPSAQKQGEGVAVFLQLLGACVRQGSPTAKCLVLFFLLWLLPESTRRTFRHWGKKFHLARLVFAS
jgi:hypothetical protein